jgi:alpha-beta hydrolase superfamily lysophospholipase
MFRIRTFSLVCCLSLLSTISWAQSAKPELILPGETFEIEGRPAFVFLPKETLKQTAQPWVLYCITVPGYPDVHEKWLHEQLLNAGVAVAGVDAGESFGSPAGVKLMDSLYEYLVSKRHFSKRPAVLGRSRGGLQAMSWIATGPERAAGLAGIYPNYDLRAYPGIDKAASAYGLSAADLALQEPKLNPIHKAKVLAAAKVPAFMLHGDNDTVVPIEPNSKTVQEVYQQAGMKELAQLVVIEGGKHDFDERWFRNQAMVDFLIRTSLAK